MAKSDWKKCITDGLGNEAPITHLSFQAAKKFFAVDSSGSTYGPRIRAEGDAVCRIHSNPLDSVIKWDHRCLGIPELVDKITPRYFNESGGGTSPQDILKNDSAVQEINSSDLWCLLTDGAIDQFSVTELTQLANRQSLTHIPVVLIIVGDKTSTPEQTNISAGIPFYVNNQEAVILFKDVKAGEIFVIAAKGAFGPLIECKSEPSSIDLSHWASLPVFPDEKSLMKKIEELGIAFISSQDRRITKEVSLGIKWEASTKALVDVDILLGQAKIELDDLHNLLEVEAISSLALICKTRNRLQDLRALLIRHKQQEVSIRLEDRHGAREILEDMHHDDLTQAMSDKLRERLREAHAANRASYLHLIGSPSEDVRVAREINRLIDHGLAILAETEKASYTADLVNRKSNRARRALVTTSNDAITHLSSLDLSDSGDAFRNTCSICCGENQIMSVVLKKLDTVEENTTDFALNFPLAAGQGKQNNDMISAQFICFQCALICQNSIFKEDLSAILPTVQYLGASKAYINHQLTLAVTGGLSTGVSGIGQIFMAILDRTLETKHWCSDQSHVELIHVDQEITARRLALKWMLNTLLHNCKTKENFNETGIWVDYPKALRWAIDDFQRLGLDSWAIQYPLVGFTQLMRWYDILDLELPRDALSNLLETKLIHHTVTIYMTYLLRKKGDGEEWRDSFMGLLYEEFNVPGIPRDMGTASIVEAKNFWNRLETALGQRPDIKCFLSLFDVSARMGMCKRIQLITFWALFTQKGHTTPKTFFQDLRLREILASAALDATSELPESEVTNVLLSIFSRARSPTDIIHQTEFIPPFLSPFGASVLTCGYPGCHVKFYSKADLCPIPVDEIRKNRAQHLKAVYGLTPQFNSSATGLPDRTSAPGPPSSANCNLHISIARVWSTLDRSLEAGRGQASSCEAKRSPTQESQLSKEAVLSWNEAAVAEFITKVIFEICAANHRGDIYHNGLSADVRAALPSFFQALRVASRKSGLADGSGLAYVHDWDAGNRLQAKIEYELSL